MAQCPFPVQIPVLGLNLTKDWYLLCVTVQEKTRVLHDDQAPGFLDALQEAAKWGSVLPNEVTQLAEPAGDFLQQLHSGHSAQVVCTRMTTNENQEPSYDGPFLKHSSVEPQTLPQMSQKPIQTVGCLVL